MGRVVWSGGPLGNSFSQLSGAAPCENQPSVHMMAAVRTHWNQVTNRGASMSFLFASDELGMSSLLANTSVMDTRKYSPTTPAMRRCSVTAIAAAAAAAAARTTRRTTGRRSPATQQPQRPYGEGEGEVGVQTVEGDDEWQMAARETLGASQNDSLEGWHTLE